MTKRIKLLYFYDTFCVRALATLLEGLASIPITHVVAHNYL